MTLFSRPISAADVRELMDLTVADDPHTQTMAEIQEQGIAALYGILCKQHVALLADDVGMGKTYQALGLAALVWNEKPEARILFISPSQTLQSNWTHEYARFFAGNYRRAEGVGDDRGTAAAFGTPLRRAVAFDNLRDWVDTLGRPEAIASFLRHPSFTRPVFLTEAQAKAPEAAWTHTRQLCVSLGLHDVRRPKPWSVDQASFELNRAFAAALNAHLGRLSSDGPYFDLIIVDESQCLRIPTNQTNTVIYEALKGRAAKWLFMSATPAHGGPGDIPKILNHYPGPPEVIPADLATKPAELREALLPFIVRRTRRYRTADAHRSVGKTEYRSHDAATWRVDSQEMSTMGTLAMGLVQKRLVDVLAGRNNRFRIGFLSCFESLQASLASASGVAQRPDDEHAEHKLDDFHRERADGEVERAPDAQFVDDLARDFDREFSRRLPHPKVEALVDRLAPRAFGTAHEPGGEKFLVFVRRTSTVDTLRDRLDRAYHKAIEDRVERYWRRKLDWVKGGGALDTPDPVEEIASVAELGEDLDPVSAAESPDHPVEAQRPFRVAMSQAIAATPAKGAQPARPARPAGWLFNFRERFRDGRSNALFFEDGWLLRLCRAGGVQPSEAAGKIDREILRESWTAATQKSGTGRTQHFKARRLRYVALHALRRCPQAFGLDTSAAATWLRAYEVILHDVAERQVPSPLQRDNDATELFEPTFWDHWDTKFGVGPLALPLADPSAESGEPLFEGLCRRNVARTLLGQNIRLTDRIIDLYFARDKVGHDAGSAALANAFLEFVASKDPAAVQCHVEFGQWIQHLRLIVDSCLDSKLAGQPWSVLARQKNWPELNDPTAVMGVVGGSGKHLEVTRHFRTPSLPRIVVCTDTLKQGVNLHLFCDQVLHYGLAWTSGDLEQRVGRVDRYFSQIERRLAGSTPDEDVRLGVGYPHVEASLEREQVNRVLTRLLEMETLMDSPLWDSRDESKDIVVGGVSTRIQKTRLEPFPLPRLPSRPRGLGAITKLDGEHAQKHYQAWKKALEAAVSSTLRWHFDLPLRRWFVSGATKGLALLIPLPEEGDDTRLIRHAASALRDGTLPDGKRGVFHRRSAVATLTELPASVWGKPLDHGNVESCLVHKNESTALGALRLDAAAKQVLFEVTILHGRLPTTMAQRLEAEIGARAAAWRWRLCGVWGKPSRDLGLPRRP